MSGLRDSCRSSLLVLCVVAKLAVSLELPSFDEQGSQTVSSSTLTQNGKWWVRVDNRVYHSPPTSFLSLSSNISNYYYAFGSMEAIPARILSHRVGGEGRLHIFHFASSSMLESAAAMRLELGDRRAAMSRFTRLHGKETLSSTFPEYTLTKDYIYPLGPKGEDVEVAAASKLTEQLVKDYLVKFTALKSRSYTSESASDSAEKVAEDAFREMNLPLASVCLQSFEAEGKTLKNVIAYVPGVAPGSVVLGAHYDSRPFEGLAPGAEDNGSGVASMLAIAKAYALSGVRPKKSLYFVAFAGEEGGLYGSKEFASALKSNSLPTTCSATMPSYLQVNRNHGTHNAIVMDEVGWVSPALARRTVNLESYDTSKEILDHLAQSSKLHNGDGLNIVHSNNPFGSDHMSFEDNDMRAVLTINGDDEKYPNYHQSTDTIENVNFGYATQIAKMAMGAVYRMSRLQEQKSAHADC
eukprot:TRINITY_DN15430_c0_g1_i1.p1 TRINITY_DN15430_c0_g1~~TRINITY_DN15430_c0_g1_i1.p1  ORF type:complete len:467 (-),score=46.85 TRINITY_DN15430_c0_g1_i1:215-1615(-)